MHDIPGQASEEADPAHGEDTHPQGQAQSGVDRGEELTDCFLEKYVGGEDEGESDAEEEGEVGEAGLRPGDHQVPVIEAEEEAAGEQWEEAAVEDLSYEDDVGPVN